VVTVDLDHGRKRVQLEESDPEDPAAIGLATVLFAFSLFISAPVLGWPETSAVQATFQQNS